MKSQDQEQLMNLTLEEKVEQSKKVIGEALTKFSGNEVYLAWTGGKDSTTMLWLYRETCRELGQPMPGAMFIDEGHVFEEILELVNRVKREWNVEVAVVKNTDVSDKAENKEYVGLDRLATETPRYGHSSLQGRHRLTQTF